MPRMSPPLKRIQVKPRLRECADQNQQCPARSSTKGITNRDSATGAKFYRPPKSLLNDLNTRLGKSPVFEGTPGACCANGHCAPPCTWHATVGTLSAGRS